MILCICQRGNVRSATTAQVLRDFFGLRDVFATGIDTTSAEMLHKLCEMGPMIVTVGDQNVYDKVRNMCTNIPVTYLNVGEDRWLMPGHPALVAVLVHKLLEAGFVPAGTFEAKPDVYIAAHTAAWNRIHI